MNLIFKNVPSYFKDNFWATNWYLILVFIRIIIKSEQLKKKIKVVTTHVLWCIFNDSQKHKIVLITNFGLLWIAVICMFTDLICYLFIYLFIYWFVHLFIDSSIYTLIYSYSWCGIIMKTWEYTVQPKNLNTSHSFCFAPCCEVGIILDLVFALFCFLKFDFYI